MKLYPHTFVQHNTEVSARNAWVDEGKCFDKPRHIHIVMNNDGSVKSTFPPLPGTKAMKFERNLLMI